MQAIRDDKTLIFFDGYRTLKFFSSIGFVFLAFPTQSQSRFFGLMARGSFLEAYKAFPNIWVNSSYFLGLIFGFIFMLLEVPRLIRKLLKNDQIESALFFRLRILANEALLLVCLSALFKLIEDVFHLISPWIAKLS